MNKKTLSEADICAKFITPALMKAGWSEVEQVFREYTLRPGRVVVQGSHSRRDKRSGRTDRAGRIMFCVGLTFLVFAGIAQIWL